MTHCINFMVFSFLLRVIIYSTVFAEGKHLESEAYMKIDLKILKEQAVVLEMKIFLFIGVNEWLEGEEPMDRNPRKECFHMQR